MTTKNSVHDDGDNTNIFPSQDLMTGKEIHPNESLTQKQQSIPVGDSAEEQQQLEPDLSEKLNMPQIQKNSGEDFEEQEEEKTNSEEMEEKHETEYQNHIMMRDNVIEQLYKSALDGEDLRRLAVGKHFKAVDDLINIHGQHLDEIQNEFQQCMNNVMDRYKRLQEEMATIYESDRLKLLEDIRQLENSARQESTMEEREKKQEINEVRTKMADDMKNLRNIFDSQFEELDERFETTKNEHLQKTELVSESLQKQLLKKEQVSKEMSSANQKIDTLRKALRRIRRISIQKSMQNMDRCNHLLARKTQIISRYKGTKTKMEEMCKLQQNKLKELTLAAHRKRLELHEELNSAEHVFKMVKLVHKLEKQYEGLTGDKISNSCDGTDVTTIIINRYIRVLVNHKEIQSKEKTLLLENKELQKQSELF